MGDPELTQAVLDELSRDPGISSSRIAVVAADGVVTLRGTTHTLREKVEAKRAARRVSGVVEVIDDLQPRVLAARSDRELRAAVLQAMMLDRLVPATIDASVSEGTVTLSGTAVWQHERDEADLVASRIPGVRAIRDEVVIAFPTPVPGEGR
jgi:osmotically-inducible protein OsmY